MAQILSIYGLVTSVIISNDLMEKMTLYTGFVQLGAGLAAGFVIGIVRDAGGKQPRISNISRANAQGFSSANVQQPRLYPAMVPILILSEVLGLYGLVVAMLMLSRSTLGVTVCKF